MYAGLQVTLCITQANYCPFKLTMSYIEPVQTLNKKNSIKSRKM